MLICVPAHGLLCFRYILSISNVDEIVEYVGDLLQGTEGKKQEFLAELLERWRRCQKQQDREPELIPMRAGE